MFLLGQDAWPPDTTITVFVTEGLYGGGLGGLEGADAICQQEADAAGLPGVFKAWLSDSTGDPHSRFVHSVLPYVLPDGTPIADNWVHLTSVGYNIYLHHPIDMTATGGMPAPQPNNSHEYSVWTATGADGKAVPEQDCFNWRSGDVEDNGYSGNWRLVTDRWTDFSVEGCDNGRASYCFQQ
jgi:hypothetical protein